jgi:hypothetical protein
MDRLHVLEICKLRCTVSAIAVSRRLFEGGKGSTNVWLAGNGNLFKKVQANSLVAQPPRHYQSNLPI